MESFTTPASLPTPRPSISQRCYSSKPPEARPYQPRVVQVAPPQRAANATPEYPYSFLRRLFWPFGKPSPRPQPEPRGLRDLSRGVEATQHVAAGGKLPPRYRRDARRVTAIICAMPLVLYLSYELYQRQFLGKEQKRVPRPALDSDTAVNEGNDDTRI